MKIPLSWLRDYVDVTLAVPQLVERLTLAGLEVASVRPIGLPTPEGLRAKVEESGPIWDKDKVMVAQVLSVDKHPNADKLRLVTVDYGARESKVVVTGAPNVQIGDSGYKVIIGLTGTVYWDGHVTPKQLGTLKPTKIRGYPSDAMVMSEFELGISEEHEGIIRLGDDAPDPGTPLAEYIGDVVIEIDVLPNMARCLSMIGVAREVAAITGGKLRYPAHAMQAMGEAIEGRVRVEIEDAKLSARYAAALLEGVKIGPAPGWMQRRLAYAGMRPISNIVDVTNYVMLEWGQPLHAFDYDKLSERVGGKAPTIIIRPAKAGEKIKTLDGQLRELKPDILVIADLAGPVAIAGVMGGAETEVSAETKNILLESANFDFVCIRRTMRALDLPSEASVRFSKGIHPETVRPTAERAAELMRKHAGATICKGLVDCYPAPSQPQVITLSLHEVRRILGTDFPREDAIRTLHALEFSVLPIDAETLSVTIPPHRCDIEEGQADLIEELARIRGYDRLPATLLADELPQQQGNTRLVLEERVRDILVTTGLQEVITYSLTTREREAPLGLSKGEYVQLLNPISSERTVMRQTVLAGVLEVLAANLRHTDDVRVFEIGPVFLPSSGEALPDEPVRLAIAMTGKRAPEFWSKTTKSPPVDFFDIKGVTEGLASDLHLPAVTMRKASPHYLHPSKAAEILVEGQSVGTFGELHPRVGAAFGLGGRAVLAGELDLQTILSRVPGRFAYTPVPRFPAALRDIALELDESVAAERVVAEIRAAGGDLLSGVRLFDLYRGESIASGKKSLAFALTYQADDRTLTDKEVDKAHKRIEDRLTHILKAQVRGKEDL
jgi:phenylalanyl-tRNA synthetase beta chain